MARSTSKRALLQVSKENFDKLNSFIEALSPAEQNKDFPKGAMNRNIRDVLAHLHHWHLMFLWWYEVGMAGGIPDMPAKGYTWKMTPQLNKWILEQYQKTELMEVKKLFYQSYQDVQDIIEKHTNEELFEKKKYKWTGSTSLGAYLVSATSSHYDWALKLIKKAKK